MPARQRQKRDHALHVVQKFSLQHSSEVICLSQSCYVHLSPSHYLLCSLQLQQLLIQHA